MKNIKMLKKLVVLVISIGLIVTFSNFAYAADEDPFFEIKPENTSSNESTNTSTNETTNNTTNNTTNTDSNNSLFTNIESNNTTTNNSTLTTNNSVNTTNTSNNVTNRSVTNTETLAKTGLSDSKGMISLIVVICGISAVYSYKKINDYKKI